MGEWLITLICQVACEPGIFEYATSALLVEKLDGQQGVRLPRRAAQLERVAL
jgi:hypothetical protein